MKKNEPNKRVQPTALRAVADAGRSAKMKPINAKKWSTGIASAILGFSGAAALIGGESSMSGYRIEGMSARLAGTIFIMGAIYGIWLIFRKEKSDIDG